MATTADGSATTVDSNGHLLGGMTWTQALDILIETDDHEIFTTGLIHAVGHEGNTCLFRPPIQQRCARLRLEAPHLYDGAVLELVSASMPQRWREWDQTIATLSLAQRRNDPHAFPTPQPGADLLAKTLPPLRCFVAELLAEGLTILAGKPKKGKSYLALDMCLSIAVGRQAFRHFATEQARVLYISLEDGERRLQRRLRQIQPNLTTPDGLDFLYTFPRLGEGALEALTHYLQTYQVIIIDVIGRILPAQTTARKSLSEYQELTDVLGPIQQLAEVHKSAVVLIDHMRKAEAEDATDTVMGSQGKTGAADHVLTYMRKGEEKDGALTITSRDLDPQKIILSMVDGHLEFIGKGESYELDSEQNRIVKVLEEERRPVNIHEIMKALGVGESHYQRFRVVMHRLYHEDRIGRTKRGLYTLYGHDRYVDDVAAPTTRHPARYPGEEDEDDEQF